MIVGLLGIFKAGGACIPLVPTYSKERLALMLSDAQVPVLLTNVYGTTGCTVDVTCCDVRTSVKPVIGIP